MQPLSRNKRMTYLAVFTVLFVIAIPTLIAYSIGYRLGDAFSLVKTGGVYVYSEISGVSVYIDGELAKETGFLLRNSFIQNLKPDRYEIRVAKEGYREWVKTIRVYPNKVAEIHPFTLPTQLSLRLVSRYLDSSGAATSTNQSIRRVLNPEYEEAAELFVTATTTVAAKPVTRPVTATSSSSTLPVVDPRTLEPGFIKRDDLYAWLDKGAVVLEWTGSYDRTPYYFCDDGICRPRVTVSLDRPIKSFGWYSRRDDVLLVVTDRGVYATEVDDRSALNVYEIYEGTGLDARVSPSGDVVVKNGDSFFVVEE